MSNKASSKKRLLEKVLAHLTDMGDSEDDETNEKQSEKEEDYDEETESEVTGYIVTCNDVKNTDEQDPLISAMLSTKRDDECRYFIDSACRGAHVLKTSSAIDRTLALSKLPTIQGITGHKLEPNAAGHLANVDGVALVTPNAGANLLSLMEMIKHNRGSFKGNKDTLIVYDGHGNIILKGVNQGDDLWSCEERDLRRRLVHAYPSDAMPETDLENEDQHTVYELDNGQIGPDDGPLVTTKNANAQKRRIISVRVYVIQVITP